MPIDGEKKITVKLLKKGKINFDGGNSELEVIELYHWLEYIYYTFRKFILVDIASIKNTYDEKAMAEINSDDMIYSDGEDEETYDKSTKEKLKSSAPWKPSQIRNNRDNPSQDQNNLSSAYYVEQKSLGDLIMDNLRS
jgi:hypothetical protein